MGIGDRTVPRWVVAAVAGVVVVALVIWLRDGASDVDEATAGGPFALSEGVTDQTMAELIDLATAGTRGRYHARYEQSDGTVMEVWRRDDDVRQDVIAADGHTVRVVRRDGMTTRCDQPVGGQWRCIDVVNDSEADVTARLIRDLRGAGLEVADDEIAGATARCFSSRPGGDGGMESVAICLTEHGVLARLVADDQLLEMSSLDGDIPGDVFDLPAETTS
jgi:hypothetical protein